MSIEFGSKVRIAAKYYRYKGRGIREWRREYIEAYGLYIGYRTLANGSNVWLGDYDEQYNDWMPEEYLQTALVVLSPRTNPIYVPFDSIVVVEENRA